VPEETFWYNLRESGNWWHIGMILLFGHFFVPFLFLLQNPLKKKNGSMIFICVWLLAIQLLDFIYNILPALRTADGTPRDFIPTVWDVTALVGVGAICLGAFFSSYARTRCIPIRDPRIRESLNCHE
jgi:hypothetical protein